MRGLIATEFVPVEDLITGDRLPVRDGQGRRMRDRVCTVISSTSGRGGTIRLTYRRESTGRVFQVAFKLGTKFEREGLTA